MDTIQSKLFLLVLISITAHCIRVDPNTSLFVDQYNRYTVYHGVNAVYKTFPFYPYTEHFDSNFSLNDADLYNLRNWGMNVIRLHAAWQGVYPQRGYYNYTYVEKLRYIVRKCNKYGIMVLLDAHQDLFIRQFCGYGLPDWVATRTNFPAPLPVHIYFDKYGLPKRYDCLKVAFSYFYMSYDVMKLQYDLFTNQRGLLDHLCKFWQILAAYMSSYSNIIGYEFINEPIGDNVFADPLGTLYPGMSNDKYLLPAYKRIYAAIRMIDRHTPIFFEPSIIDLFGGSFMETPGGEYYLELQVFSYHVYCPYVTKLGEPKSTQFCQVFDALTVASKEANLKKLRVGGFLTEYGALSGTAKSAYYITTITDLVGEYFRSWTYWQFKYYNDITTMASPGTTESFYDENGNLQEVKVKALARPYAYAICGTPLKYTFKKGVYTLVWVASDDCFNQKTYIFLSYGYYFPSGLSFSFNNCAGCQLVRLSNWYINYFQVLLDTKAINKRITLQVSPQ